MTTATQDPGAAAREARATKRSQQLLDAAARLMAKDGSQAVSMQALAAEAGVSVGLIYRYFGGKDDVLLAVIVDVLDAFATRVPAAIAEAGEDPVHRLAAAFAAYCRVIDEHRHAAVLTYRESKSLSDAGRARIMELEVTTSQPLRECVVAGIDAGLLRAVDPDLVTYDLVLLAHAWALKHWWFADSMDIDGYVAHQTALTLHAVLEARVRRRYAALVDAAGI